MEPALRYPLRVRLLCPSNPRVLSPPTPFASLPLLSLSLSPVQLPEAPQDVVFERRGRGIDEPLLAQGAPRPLSTHLAPI